MLKTQGRLDVLINAAGVVNRKALKQSTVIDWDKSNEKRLMYVVAMNINVRASFQLMSMAVPFLKDSKGTVVNVSAAAGITPEPGAMIFSVSKAMVNMLTKCAALELGGFGIRVNAVAPGFVDTPSRMTAGEASMDLSEKEYTVLKGKTENATPLSNKVCDPDEVADSILWLASNDASYVTGEILVLDGGQSLTTNLYESQIEDMVLLL